MLIFSLISAGAIKSCQNLKLDAGECLSVQQAALLTQVWMTNFLLASVWSEGLTADLFITPDHDGEAGYTLVLTGDREVTEVQQWVGEISSEDNRFLQFQQFWNLLFLMAHITPGCGPW